MTRVTLALVVLVSASPAAHGYVLTRTDAGNPVRWPMRCIVLAPDARGNQSPDEIDDVIIDETLSRSVGTWNARLKDCSYMKLGVVSATRALEAVSDGRPALVFRAERWGRGTREYDPSAIGITTVWFADRPDRAGDGQITDADIELNAVNYTFTTNPAGAVARTGTRVADLENTLTHELGHVLGLAHTCWDHTTDLPPEDDTGAPAPDCESPSLPSKVTGATMFPYASERTTSMRVVGDDDVQGVCRSYPIDSTPTACYGFIEGPGCAIAPPPSPGRMFMWAIVLALAVVARRRISRRWHAKL